jgi:hypothetical protein
LLSTFARCVYPVLGAKGAVPVRHQNTDVRGDGTVLRNICEMSTALSTYANRVILENTCVRSISWLSNRFWGEERESRRDLHANFLNSPFLIFRTCRELQRPLASQLLLLVMPSLKRERRTQVYRFIIYFHFFLLNSYLKCVGFCEVSFVRSKMVPV